MGLQQNIGNQGEALAQSFLENLGYRTQAQNFRAGKGEIDLILRTPDEWLVFVEVKARKNANFGQPEQFVSKGQKAMIRRTAEAYMRAHGWQMKIRFDIISILFTQPPQIDHFKDAF